ncbi:MAG: hypothetical protein AAF591_14040 [Verrucomicrobiota bacterium]
MKIAFILSWVLWSLLLLAWPADLLVATQLANTPKPDPAIASPDPAIVALISIITLALTFAARWFLLRFLIHPNRIAPDSAWGAILFFIAAFLIWSMTKSVETYGLILFFSSHNIPLYLAFWLPSLIIFLFHMPHLLKPKSPPPQPPPTP